MLGRKTSAGLLLAATLALVGCNRATGRPAETPAAGPAPAVAPSPEPAGGQAPQSNAGDALGAPTAQQSRDERMLAFVRRYYAARTAGDRQTVLTMTGGSYRERALNTLGTDAGVAVAIERLEWVGSDPQDQQPSPTVVRSRGQQRGGIRLRLEPVAEDWRIVDLLDPTTGRWLSAPPLPTAAFPAARAPELKAFLTQFYQARSFQNGQANLGALEPLTDLQGYYLYLRNLLRNPKVQAEQYQVLALNVRQWVPDGKTGAGTADVEVTRRLTTTDKQGATSSAQGVARLRVQRTVDKDGKGHLTVIDGFLPDDNAWVTTMQWSGLLVAA